MSQYQDITVLLVHLGITQRDIAKKAGVTPATVSTVIHGRGRSYNVEKIITELTGYKFPPFKQFPRTLSASTS